MQPITARPCAEEVIPDLACACATLRRAARAVSHFYAEEFDGLLEGPQFSLLAVLNRRPGISQITLAGILILDKTTLSRNLGLMRRKGWIELTVTDDKRERGFELTASGHALLKIARPRWQRAQERLRAALGETEWARMFGVANSVTRTVLNSESKSQTK